MPCAGSLLATAGAGHCGQPERSTNGPGHAEFGGVQGASPARTTLPGAGEAGDAAGPGEVVQDSAT